MENKIILTLGLQTVLSHNVIYFICVNSVIVVYEIHIKQKINRRAAQNSVLKNWMTFEIDSGLERLVNLTLFVMS